MRPAAASLVFTPLDGARARLLHATMPVSSYFVSRRAQRVAAMGVISILVALVGTAVAPMWMLALGPIVLGVPHLLADLRYCVVRPAWHRQPAMWIGVGVPLLLVAVTGHTAVGFAAVAGACAASSGPRLRVLLVMGLAITAAVVCVWAGPRASLVLVHLHNVVAVILWWRWREGPTRLRALPVAAFLAGSLLIACGGLDPVLATLAGGPLGGDLSMHMHSLAPGLDGVLGLRVVLLFCFAQSVHYVIWLRLVPEDDRARPTPRSFHASWRALVDELGVAVPCVAMLLALALAIWAVADLHAARLGYLRAAEFHVFLELALLGQLVIHSRTIQENK